MAIRDFKDFFLGVLLTSVLVLTGQAWQTARVSWEYSGNDAAGAPETPVRAEYAVVPEGETIDNAVATFVIDLVSTPGAPLESSEYRADLLPFSAVANGTYSVFTRIYDAENNGSNWIQSNSEVIEDPAPPVPTYPQQIPVSGNNGEYSLSGTLTLDKVAP